MRQGLQTPAREGAVALPAWGWAVLAVLAGAGIGVAGPMGSRPALAAVAIVGIATLAAIAVWPRFGLLAMAASFPLDTAGRLLSDPVTITVFHVLLLATLVSWGVRAAREPKAWVRPSLVDLGMLALVAAGLWSLPGSLAPSSTVFAIVRLVFLALLVLAYESLATSENIVARILDIVQATGVLMALLVFGQRFFPGAVPAGTTVLVTIDGQKVSRISGFFDDPNYLAGFLAVVAIVAMARLVHAPAWRHAAVHALVAAATSGALVLTLSRTGWVGVIAGALIVVLTAPKRRRLAIVLTSVMLVVVLAAGASDVVISRFESIQVGSDRSTDTRILMAASTIDIIEDEWAFGTGLNAFDRLYPQYRLPGSDWRVIRPHQIPIAMFAEMGVAGLLAELLLLWAVARQFLRRRGRPLTEFEAVALAGVVSLLLQSLFQYYLYFEYLWLFIALSVVARRLADSREAVGG